MTGWAEDLKATAPEAEATEPPPDAEAAEAAARELAKLPPLEYDRKRVNIPRRCHLLANSLLARVSIHYILQLVEQTGQNYLSAVEASSFDRRSSRE